MKIDKKLIFPILLLIILSVGQVVAPSVIDHQQLKTGPVLKSEKVHNTPIKIKIGPNVQVNALQQAFPNGLIGRSETTITKVDDQHLVAGYNDAQGFCGPPFNVPCSPNPNPGISGFAFSINGGLIWKDGGSPPVINNVYTAGDPWLDYGGLNGNTVYFANLIIDSITGASLGIGVHRGNFVGNNFVWNDVHTIDSPKNSKKPGSDFYDKEAIAVSKESKNAYVSLTNFQKLCGIPQAGFGQIEVWRTSDGGDNWLGPSIAGPEDPVSKTSCGNKGAMQQISVPTIGPKGEVYVAWQAGPTFNNFGISTNGKIKIATSLDGAVTFDSPVTVANFNSMFFDKPNGYNRDLLLNNPSIAVATTGKNKGRVYVVFYSAISPVSKSPSIVSSQVYLTFSDDKGKIWSTPIPIAPTVPPKGIKRFWPVITIQPGGNVDIVYLESQDSISDSLVNTFWVQSTDGGTTFNAPIKVSTSTSDWGAASSDIIPNFGDYIGSDSSGNHAFPIWADARNGEPDVFFAPAKGAGKS